MKETQQDRSLDLPEALLEEAAIWQARIQDAREASLAEKQALYRQFNAWLAADACHRQAFEEMETLWGALEQPVAQIMKDVQYHDVSHVEEETNASCYPQASRSMMHRLFRPLASAACLFLVLLIGLGWQQDWITQWQSDYKTAVGEQSLVNLDDGSRVTLNTNTALVQRYSAEQRLVRLLKGEAWFVVSPDDERPFVVETPKGSVNVTGTEFNVRIENTSVVVSLEKGEVWLDALGQTHTPSLKLTPGEQARLTSEQVSQPMPFDQISVTAWLRGQFVFYNTPMSEVVDTLNRYRPGRIQITNTELKGLEVSGVFSISDPDSALEVITNTLPIQQTRMTDYWVLLR